MSNFLGGPRYVATKTDTQSREGRGFGGRCCPRFFVEFHDAPSSSADTEYLSVWQSTRLCASHDP